jgi:hypothetical protein
LPNAGEGCIKHASLSLFQRIEGWGVCGGLKMKARAYYLDAETNEAELNPGILAEEQSVRILLAEVTEALRHLHNLIEGYGPMWYSEQIDSEVGAALAAADAALSRGSAVQ